MLAKKNLELNPHHSIMKEMLQKVKMLEDGETMDEEVEDLAMVMWNMAMLNSGFAIDTPSSFTEPLHRLLKTNFGLDPEEPITEIEVEIDEDPEPVDEPEIKFEGSDGIKIEQVDSPPHDDL